MYVLDAECFIPFASILAMLPLIPLIGFLKMKKVSTSSISFTTSYIALGKLLGRRLFI